MADNDNLQQQAEAERKARVAQQNKPKPKVRKRGGPAPYLNADEAARERMRKEAAAKAAKRKKELEATRKKKAEAARVTETYRRALANARRAAEQYNNTGNTNDMIAFDRARSALNTAGAEFKKVTGQAVESVQIKPKAKNVRGYTSPDKPYVVKSTGATGPVKVSSEAPRARRVPGAVPSTSFAQGSTSSLAKADGYGGYSADLINAVLRRHPELKTPADAVKWLQDNGAEAADTAGGGAGSPSRTVSVQRQVQRFTTQQLEATATRVAQDALGRALTADELARITGVVNKEAAKNPTISRTVTRYKGANSTSSTTTKGGLDEAQVIKSQVEQGNEYSAYQTATTYFDAMLGALRGPAGGSI